MTQQYEKAPTARLNYGRDWSEWLEDGDFIVTSTWTLDPDNADTALQVVTNSHTTDLTAVVLAGGTLGVRYRVTNHVITQQGFEDERSAYWEIIER